MSHASFATVSLVAFAALSLAPLASATEGACHEAVNVCVYPGAQKDPPACEEPGAEARRLGASIGERSGAIHAGTWETCSNEGSSSTSYQRVGAWIFLGSFLVDVGYNHDSSDQGSSSSDLYVLHGGIPAAWYYEQHSEEGSFCTLNVRVFLSVGAGSQTPCVSEHAPGVLP